MNVRPYLCSLFALLSTLGCATDAAPITETPVELIPREALFRSAARTQVRLSPSGSHLTWIASDSGVARLWIAPRDSLAGARALTARGDGIVSSYEWARNGKRLVMRQDRTGDGRWHIYALDIDTGAEMNLTPFEQGRANIAAVSLARPDEIAVLANTRDPNAFDAWRIDMRTGTRTLLFQNTDSLHDLVFDHDLTPRLGLRGNEDGSVTAMRIDAGRIGPPVLTIPMDGARTTSILGTDSAGRYAFVLGHRGNDKSSITRIDLETLEESTIATGSRADIHAVIIDPAHGVPAAYAEHYFRNEWRPLSDDIAAELRALTAKLDGDYHIVDRTQDDAYWLVSASGAADPGGYYLYDRQGGSITELFPSRPELRNYVLAPTHLVELTARDGLPLVGYLTLPVGSDRDGDGRPERPIPMVLSVHGGPWSRSTFGFNPVTQFFGNRGYAVLDVNYRGSKGYGAKVFTASFGQWGGAILHDLLDAVAWAVSERIAPDDSVAIYGHSFGGFATLAALAFAPEAFRCGIEYAGISNLFTQIATMAVSGDSPYGFYRQTIGDPETPEGRARLRAQSPLFSADRISVPLLIAHGSGDRIVPQSEADQIVAAMSANDQPVIYLVFPDEGHNFSRPGNQAAFRAVSEAFLAQCLGGRAEHFDDAFERTSMIVPTGVEHLPGLAASLSRDSTIAPQRNEKP